MESCCSYRCGEDKENQVKTSKQREFEHSSSVAYPPTLPNTKKAIEVLGIVCWCDCSSPHPLRSRYRYSMNSGLGHNTQHFFGPEPLNDPVLFWVRELIHDEFGFDPSTETVFDAIRTLGARRYVGDTIAPITEDQAEADAETPTEA